MTEKIKKPKVDEILYSRQIYALGFDTIDKLSSSSVLISGMGGLGVEIAKNIILSGINNVTIHDTQNTEINDLASNFYLSEESIGKNRAIESFLQLSNLNKYVTVCVKTEKLTNELMKKHDCVVITSFLSESEIKKISSFCHQNDIKLIITETRGLFGYIFTDFGENFVVTDPIGTPQSRFALSDVTQSNHGLVTIANFEDYDLYDGDRVTFEEVEGMTELNGKEFEIKVINRYQFTISDTSSFSKYSSIHNCGYGKKIIVPEVYNFLEFEKALKKPEIMQVPFDLCTFGHEQQVLLAFIALQHFLDKNHKNSTEISSNELLESAKEINFILKIVEEIDEETIREFARESRSVICPVCSIFGGIASQEIIKSISSKFVPIHQFLAMGWTHLLPKNTTCNLKNDRYDPYRIIFGNKQQEIMESLRYFIVGLGSMGCEYLKIFSMMGVAENQKGHLYITDSKSIKKSNLSHQFLFKNDDIGKMKSEVAVKSVHEMNPNINITSKQEKLNKESTKIFNDYFYQHLDGVCNAVDNNLTRFFSDKKCVFYGLPQIISQTTELSANFQVVIPKITECYSDFPELFEKQYEISAAYNFPSTFDECCLWSNDKFIDFFENSPRSICSLFKDKNYIIKMKEKNQSELRRVLLIAKNFYVDEKCENFDDCIKWARIKFDELFNYIIKLIIDRYPEDKTLDNGVLFWSGKRKFPRPVIFDPNDKNHAQFVETAAILRTRICQIESENVDIPQKASYFQIPDIQIHEKERSYILSNKDSKKEEEEEIESLIKELAPYIEKPGQKPPEPETFLSDENENDDNDFSNICFHLIESTVNIRASNYHIETKDRFYIKKFLRKINPSVITTSSIVSGLASLEMYKIHCVDGNQEINDFRFGQINLASSNFCIVEPMPFKIKELEATKYKFSIWDKWIITGDLTIGDFMKEIYEKYELIVDMITCGSLLIYPKFNDDEVTRKRIMTKISDIITNEFNQPPLEEGQYFLEIDCICTDNDGNDVDETPSIYLKIKDY